MIKVLVLSPCSQRDKRILSSASSEAVFTYLDKDTPPDIWDKEIHDELEKSAPTRGVAAGGKGKTDIVNEKYKAMLAELKAKYGIM